MKDYTYYLPENKKKRSNIRKLIFLVIFLIFILWMDYYYDKPSTRDPYWDHKDYSSQPISNKIDPSYYHPIAPLPKPVEIHYQIPPLKPFVTPVIRPVEIHYQIPPLKPFVTPVIRPVEIYHPSYNYQIPPLKPFDLQNLNKQQNPPEVEKDVVSEEEPVIDPEIEQNPPETKNEIVSENEPAIDTESVEELKVTPESIELIRKKISNILPNINIEITTEETEAGSSKFVFIISAHLLENYSAENNNPYVKGDYNTHEKLRRVVEVRIADIIREIAPVVARVTDIEKIKIRARHGVRQTTRYIGTRNYSTTVDVAMDIYIATINNQKIRESVSKIRKSYTEDIVSLWTIEKDIIQSLQIQVVF
jgi:hypothetical protein